MLDDVLKGTKIGVKSYNITVSSEMMDFSRNRPSWYSLSLEANIYDTENFDVGSLAQDLFLVTEKDISNYKKFIEWAKKEHPEVVIEFEMTKDAK